MDRKLFNRSSIEVDLFKAIGKQKKLFRTFAYRRLFKGSPQTG